MVSSLGCSAPLSSPCTFETTTPQKQPICILIGGFQGSGKSSLISRIKETYDINIISSDSIRQSLFDRGIELSPDFSMQVSALFNSLVTESLINHANVLVDANAHSRRLAEMEHLIKENNAPHKTLKIFLKTSETTLRDRVKNRKPTPGCYQGTESDLDAALSCTPLNPNDYDLIIETDTLTPNQVFESANTFISPYFKRQTFANYDG